MTDSTPELAPFTPIPPLDEAVRVAALHRVNVLTKPLGALGRLEPLAVHVCAIQGTLRPDIKDPLAVVFVADHGVADRGVSAYPRAVTAQMVKNFLAGGAAISVLARLQGMDLWVVDAGVDDDCGVHPRLVNAKIRRSTRLKIRPNTADPNDQFKKKPETKQPMGIRELVEVRVAFNQLAQDVKAFAAKMIQSNPPPKDDPQPSAS